MKKVAVFATIAFLFAGSAMADSYDYYPNTPLHLGANIDSRNLTTAHLPCIQYDAKVQWQGLDTKTPVAVTTQFTLNQIKTRSDLYNYLHFSASVSGHYSFYSGAGGFDLEQENTYDSDSFSWILSGYTEYGEFGMTNPRLVPTAQRLVDKGNIDAFRARCGTDYVAQETRSVLVAVVYTIKNVSSSDYKKLSASLSAAADAGVWGGSAQASYQSFFREAQTAGVLSFNFYAIGGDGITKLSDVPVETDDIAKTTKIVSDYMKLLDMNHSVPMQYLTGSLQDFYPALASYDFGQYNRFVGEAYIQYQDDRAKRQRLQEILNHVDDYGLSDAESSALQNTYDSLGDALTYIEDTVIQCKKLHDGKIQQIVLQASQISAKCKLDSKKVGFNISWPQEKPFHLNYWVDELSNSPQVWMYVQVTGPKISSVAVIGANNKIEALLNVRSDNTSRSALGAIQYDKLSMPELPLSVSVTLESGRVLTSPLPYAPTAPVTAPILSPGTKPTMSFHTDAGFNLPRLTQELGEAKSQTLRTYLSGPLGVTLPTETLAPTSAKIYSKADALKIMNGQ